MEKNSSEQARHWPFGPAFFRSLHLLFFTRKILLFAFLSLVIIALSFVIMKAEKRMDFVKFLDFHHLLILNFLLLAVCLFFGTALFGDEISGKTIGFLSMRPVRRGTLLLGKFAAYMVLTPCFILVPLFVSYFIMSLGEPGWGAGTFYKVVLKICLIHFLASAAFGSIATFIGLAIKKPVIVGGLLFFGWEVFVTHLPGQTRTFTLLHYVRSLVIHSGGGGKVMTNGIYHLPPGPATTGKSISVLAIVTILFLLLTLLHFRRKEFPLDQGA